MNEIKKIAFKGFFWMFLAGVLVNIVQFFSKIILARMLSPAEFGIVAIAISITTFSGFFYDFGLSSALVQRKTKIEESFNSTFMFFGFSSFFITAMLFLFSRNIAIFFNNIELENVIKLISIAIPFGALSISQTSYLSKNLLFFKRFISETIPILLGSLISIIFAVYNFGYLSLVIGYLTGSISYAILLFLLTPWKPKFSFDLTVFIELINYSKFILIGNVSAIILSQGDNFIVGKLLGASGLGYYAIAYTIATLPSVNLAHIISRVVFPMFAKLQDSERELKIGFLKTINAVNLLIMPLCIGTIIISPFLFAVILGEKWLPSHTALIILSFLGIFKSLQVIPSFFLQATGNSKKDASIISKSVLIELVLILPLTYKFGIIGAASAVTISYFFGLLNYFFGCSKCLNTTFFSSLKSLFPGFIGCVLMSIAGVLTNGILKAYTLNNMLIVILVCTLVYITVQILINKKLVYELYNSFFVFFNKEK